jgi:hypothetical protein
MLREAEQAMGKPEEFVDSMHVLEYTSALHPCLI